MVISSTCPRQNDHISAASTNGGLQAVQAGLATACPSACQLFLLRTFMGGKRAKGACPCASSRMVMPKDQMSARELYLGSALQHEHNQSPEPRALQQRSAGF